MANECKHQNISVNQVWRKDENGVKCLESEIVCDDCGTVLKEK